MKRLVFTLLLLNIACAPGMETQSLPTEKASGDICSTNCNIEEESKLLKVDLAGEVSSGIFSKHKAVEIDVPNREVIVAIPLPIPYLADSPEKEIKELPGAYYKLGQSNNGNYQLQTHIPFKYFIGDATGSVADRLPNGSKLPAIPGGELPSYAIKFTESKRDIYVYIGPSVVAAYVTTPEFNPYINLQFPIKNRDKSKILGYVSLIPEKQNYDGGVFVSAKLPDGFARFLDEILP